MLRLVNQTPFVTRAVPALDRERRDILVIVIKGTFTIPRSEGTAAIAEEQSPITLADEHHGEPGRSSVRYESDLAPGKPGTDVIMNASAYAPAGGAETLVVTLQAGALSKSVRVFGARQWSKDLTGRHRPSAPVRFVSVPLVYEHAFGGTLPAPGSASEPGAGEPAGDVRNPVGVGFLPARTAPQADDLVPCLEDPEQPLRFAGERPPPAGFGAVHRSWAPRAAFAGTCDEAWRRTRAPFLPDDFDPRYHSAAPPGMSSLRYFVGGELVRANNVRPGGLPLAFRVPQRNLAVTARLRGKDLPSSQPALDTIVIEPDLERVLCTWRAVVPCARQLLHLDRVRISESNVR